MDLNELEGLLENVISDQTSTEECRKRFERHLGTIETCGEDWLERRFLRIKNYVRTCLMTIIEEGKAGEGEYAGKLDRLQHLINQVSKSEAFGLVERSRAKIRKTIPVLRQTDKYTLVFERKLGQEIDEVTLERMVNAALKDDREEILAIGETLTDEQQIQYYDGMNIINHRRAVYAHKLYEAARRMRKPELYPAALRKMGTATVFTREDMIAYSNIARKLQDPVHMGVALKKLEQYLDFTDELVSYALTAKKLGDAEAMAKAMNKLKRNLNDTDRLNTFASLSRASRHQEHLDAAMEKLETKLDKPECLTTYAAIARDANDTEKLEKVLPLLEEQSGDPVCLTMFGSIARRLRDAAATQKSLELLERFVATDIYCLTTYAQNAIAMNDWKRKGRAMMELKRHLDDPICGQLYLKIAESGERQSIVEAPAA